MQIDSISEPAKALRDKGQLTRAILINHQLKCKHDDDERRDYKYIAINLMPATRSGETNYRVGPEHQGRYARVSGAFASGNGTKRKTDESRATRLQTTQDEERQKRIKIGDPSPPTPTKEQLIQLPKATRHSRPSCLHYGIDRAAREILYPDHFFCGNCDAYVEAMIHSTTRKSRISKDSRAYICQAGHTNYSFPTTKKSERIHHTLLPRFKEVEEEEEYDDDGIEAMLPLVVVAVAATRGLTVASSPEAATPRAATTSRCPRPLPLITSATSIATSLPRSPQSFSQRDATSSTSQPTARH
jgi:hypothetical protein